MGCDYYSTLYLWIVYADSPEEIYDINTTTYYGAWDNVTYPDKEIVDKNNANEKPIYIYSNDKPNETYALNRLHIYETSKSIPPGTYEKIKNDIENDIGKIKTIYLKTIWYVRI